MIRLSETPFILYLGFMTIYFSIGDSDSHIWSGLFFCVNYILMIWLFYHHKSKKIKIVGLSLAIALLIFSFIKYFTEYKIEKMLIFALFTLALIINFYLQKTSK